MDTVSHACFSYLVCRATGAAPTPMVGLLAAGVAVLPDLDFLLIPSLPEVARFAFHRGPSHSLFMALAAGLFAWVAARKTPRVQAGRIGLLVALAWAGHVLLDMCTGFGVALWWPLTHARSSFDLLFVVDPLASLALLAAVAWDVRSNRAQPRHRRAAVAGLLVFGAYAASAWGIRESLVHDFRVRLARRGREVRDIHAEPTPFNHQLWYLCAKTERGFVITYRSLWDGDRWERWSELPIRRHPLDRFGMHPLLDKMRTVLDDWYTCFSAEKDQLKVVDLRLGKRYGWEDDDAPYLFVYNLWRTREGRMRWSLTKPGSKYDYGRLAALFARVAGRIPERRLATEAER